MLRSLGVRFPDGITLTHDHLDACLGALIAAAADKAITCARVKREGEPLQPDGEVLWEGPILLLDLNDKMGSAVRDAPRHFVVDLPSACPQCRGNRLRLDTEMTLLEPVIVGRDPMFASRAYQLSGSSSGALTLDTQPKGCRLLPRVVC